MSNLNSLLQFSKIESLGYDTIYLEKPVSNIIDFDWKKILDAPFSNTSSSTINELRLISSETQKRTESDIELVHLIDEDLDYYFIQLMRSYNLEYPEELINNFYSIVRPLILNVKMLFNRPRPVQLAKFYNINIDIIQTDTHHTASYPSGHTVYSSLVSNIIKDKYPKINRQKLDNIVNLTAKARVLQGVHFPSDNKASIKFSNYVYNKLKDKIL
jgi:hypothetical protein